MYVLGGACCVTYDVFGMAWIMYEPGEYVVSRGISERMTLSQGMTVMTENSSMS